MAGSLNKCCLLGNVARDPEIRNTQSGSKIANLSLATSESWTDKSSGEKKERTEFHRIVCFNNGLTGVIEKYVKKGSKLYIEGSLATRKWTDQTGNDRYTTEITISAFGGVLILLTRPGEASQAPREPAERRADPPRSSAPAQSKQDWGSPTGADLDDEIPF